MHVRSNWQSSSEVKRSHWGEKEEGSISRRPVGPHILTANAGSHNGHITARSLRGGGENRHIIFRLTWASRRQQVSTPKALESDRKVKECHTSEGV